MVSSNAKSVEAYLAELPEERREVIAAVRAAILKKLPKGYVEGMSYGMISYEVPLDTYAETYNGQPLQFAGLAAQKNHYALYLSCIYQDGELRQALEQGFRDKGKKLDAGKSCIRFKKLDDLPLDVIGKIISKVTVKKFIAAYETARQTRGR